MLHPLKSELNFPIGAKAPLHRAPERWDLPIHLIEALFYAPPAADADSSTAARGCARCAETGVAVTEELLAVLGHIHRVFDKTDKEYGDQARHAVQSTPHTVLLNKQYYADVAKPLFAVWTLAWLKVQPCVREDLEELMARAGDSAAFSKSDADALVLAYIQDDALVSAEQQARKDKQADAKMLANHTAEATDEGLNTHHYKGQ